MATFTPCGAGDWNALTKQSVNAVTKNTGRIMLIRARRTWLCWSFCAGTPGSRLGGGEVAFEVTPVSS
jgi:hypothetical protein